MGIVVSCFKFPVNSSCSRIRFKFIVNVARLVPTDASLALQPNFSPAFTCVFDSQATESLIPLKDLSWPWVVATWAPLSGMLFPLFVFLIHLSRSISNASSFKTCLPLLQSQLPILPLIFPRAPSLALLRPWCFVSHRFTVSLYCSLGRKVGKTQICSSLCP